MVCEICGKTMYWCLGHAPSRFETAYRPPVTQPTVPSRDHTDGSPS